MKEPKPFSSYFAAGTASAIEDAQTSALPTDQGGVKVPEASKLQSLTTEVQEVQWNKFGAQRGFGSFSGFLPGGHFFKDAPSHYKPWQVLYQTDGAVSAVARAESVRDMVRPSHIGTLSQLLAGGIAGAVSKTCTAPLARLTILFQVQGMRNDGAKLSRPRIFTEASRIFREEGFRAFWKGNGVTIVHRLPYSSLNFFAYEEYKMYLKSALGIEGKQESLGRDMGTRLLAGGAAGVTAASLTYPLDLVRTRLAAQTNVMYYKGITHALLRIHQEEGLKGLYKGLGPTLLGVGPNIAINFCVYETLKSLWLERSTESSPIVVSLGCGSIAGICSSTATFPIDLVRRRMQLEGAGGRARVYKSGLAGTFGHIIRTEGWYGLYRGIIPEYYKVIPSVGIVFMTYEFMKQVLRPRSWDDS